MKAYIVLLSAIVLTSCSVYKPLDPGPYGNHLKEGDLVNVTFKSGLEIKDITVKHIWIDSVLLGSDNRAIQFSSIALIEKKQSTMSPLNVVLLGIAIAGSIWIYSVVSSFN